MTKPYRVVVDPGVFVSALITPSGPTAAMLDLIDSTSVEVVASTRLLAELADVLGREKFRSYFTTNEADQYLQGLRERAVVIDDPHRSRRCVATRTMTISSHSRGLQTSRR